MSVNPQVAPSSTVRTVVAAWLLVTGTFASIVTATLLSRVLTLYPPSHLASFGPIVPGVARAHAAWLPAAPMALGACAVASMLAGLYLLRSRRPVESRRFTAMVVAFANLFLSLLCTIALVVAYFYLPKLANGG
jgi:hypothetical protein